MKFDTIYCLKSVIDLSSVQYIWGNLSSLLLCVVDNFQKIDHYCFKCNIESDKCVIYRGNYSSLSLGVIDFVQLSENGLKFDIITR
jgi:hypothetical protein